MDFTDHVFHTPENYTLQAKLEKCQAAPPGFEPGCMLQHFKWTIIQLANSSGFPNTGGSSFLFLLSFFWPVFINFQCCSFYTSHDYVTLNIVYNEVWAFMRGQFLLTVPSKREYMIQFTGVHYKSTRSYSNAPDYASCYKFGMGFHTTISPSSCNYSFLDPGQTCY